MRIDEHLITEAIKGSNALLSAPTLNTSYIVTYENYLNKEQLYHSAGSFKSETFGSALITQFERMAHR